MTYKTYSLDDFDLTDAEREELQEEIGEQGLVAEQDFEDFAKDLADDLGIIDSKYSIYFDWELWASDLSSDYTTIEIKGDTFYLV